MGKETRADLLTRLEAGYSLPTLSPVALKLVELATEDTCSAKELGTLVERDPPLAVRLLKLANSAFLRTMRPVTTINDAIVKVGFQRLRITALSISLRDTFPLGKVGPLDYEEFWRISLYRALIAKSLADRLKTCNPEEAFVAGLIMEIGLLILFDLFVKDKDLDMSLQLEPLEDLVCWEKEKYGVDHRQIGEAALRYWRFPDHITVCQRAYRSPQGPRQCQPLAILCEQARILSRLVSRNPAPFLAPVEEVEKSLGLNSAVVIDILVDTLDQVEEIAEDLHIEVNKERDLMEIVEKANRALSRISEEIFKGPGFPVPKSLPSFDSLNGCQDSARRALEAVAHEIRNPLLVLGGFARKLAISLDSGSAEAKYVQIILEETSRLEKALSKMLPASGLTH
jgi:HD-like signal output (HDOD) protein